VARGLIRACGPAGCPKDSTEPPRWAYISRRHPLAVKRSQLNMAIPPEVLERLRQRAKREGVSVSALVLRTIRELLDGKQEASQPGLSVEERLEILEEKLRRLER
jgi:post-segregation antitoxin (ccd killing protein)